MSATILAPSVFDPAHPGAGATALTGDLGGQVLTLAEHLAPVAVPFVLALAAVNWVMGKFGLHDRIELSRLDREAAEQEAARHAKRERAAARKRARMDALHDEALTENRRRNLRKRVTGSYT
jgi:CBS-domain-containing membrane protein